MAHIQIQREGGIRLVVNGLDLTDEIYSESVQMVAHGDDDSAEAAIQIRIAVSRLDIGEHEDVDVQALYTMLAGGSF